MVPQISVLGNGGVAGLSSQPARARAKQQPMNDTMSLYMANLPNDPGKNQERSCKR
jgi:hypothetical protein